MKKLGIGLGILVILIGVTYVAFIRPRQIALEEVPTPTAEIITQFTADAQVVPIQYAALSYTTSGVVDHILVQEGDHVAVDAVILRLDATHQKTQVKNAEAALAEAEASYERLLAGATPEEIAIAEAQLHQSQAQLRQIEGNVTSEDVRAAQAQLEHSQAQLSRVNAGAKETDRRAAQAQFEQSEANLAMQRDQLSAAKTSAQLQLEQATEALIQAQTSYSTAMWHWNHVEAYGTDPLTPSTADPANPGRSKSNKLNDTQKQQYYDAFVQAESALHSAEQAVQQAQVAYDNARQAEINGIRAAEEQVTSTLAHVDDLAAGATIDEQAAAQAQLANAQAHLAKLRGTARAGSLDAAVAAVEVAQANLERLQAEAPESELAVARARVQSARAALDLARLELADTELRAPFAGTIASIDIKTGEYINPEVPVIQLADFSSWVIETTDLSELDVAQIHEGADVVITFDALPETELPGQVVYIKSFGESQQGDITYTVQIKPAHHDARLRWNMTATVAIMVD
ncbi:MAG: hypothetical protein GFH25_541186n415 [Chloroflexi bacterium AL-N10]|nr:hypothetical protein [Chloroflexi bacterium AL-N1]NOK66729.1 hypothetical protein [Chloroflexi bacterium AL-N10]NOK72117.1 hypothetical protein [Chloroflexi bacterium AL-N5]